MSTPKTHELTFEGFDVERIEGAEPPAFAFVVDYTDNGESKRLRLVQETSPASNGDAAVEVVIAATLKGLAEVMLKNIEQAQGTLRVTMEPDPDQPAVH